MTVTPLLNRQSRVHYRAAQRGVHTTDPTTLTLRFEVRLAGANRLTEAVEVIDAVRTVTARLVVADVDLTCDDRPAEDLLAAGLDPKARSVNDPPRPTADDADGSRHNAVVVLPDLREVHRRGELVATTRVEFDLLLFLANNRRRVFTRGQLLAQVWGFARGGERTVDVHISRLRAKLGDDLITTVRGVGYRMAAGAPVLVPDQAG